MTFFIQRDTFGTRPFSSKLFQIVKVCLHAPTPSQSPCPSPAEFDIVSMAGGRNGSGTHSSRQSARHHRHNDKPLTVTVTVTMSECVNTPLPICHNSYLSSLLQSTYKRHTLDINGSNKSTGFQASQPWLFEFNLKYLLNRQKACILLLTVKPCSHVQTQTPTPSNKNFGFYCSLWRCSHITKSNCYMWTPP